MIEDHEMTKRFNPIFTITNRITAGLTRLPVLGTADRHRAGPGVPGCRDPVRGLGEGDGTPRADP
jgi:hypothetical protein